MRLGLGVLFLASSVASASSPPVAGTVTGDVALPALGVEAPPPRFAGYVERIRNSVAEIRPFDPRPECFVYLEGGPADAEATRPSAMPVTLELAAGTFRPPLLPVIIGSTVELRNVGKKTHALFSPDAGDLTDGQPVRPGDVRSLVIKAANPVIRLHSKDSPHLEGRIVVVSTRYFARLTRDGEFSIANVPPGKWSLRVWYRDGWLPTTQVIEVGARTSPVHVILPERIAPPPASGGQGP